MSREELILKAAKARAASEQILAEKRLERDNELSRLKEQSRINSRESLSKFERELNEYVSKYS